LAAGAQEARCVGFIVVFHFGWLFVVRWFFFVFTSGIDSSVVGSEVRAVGRSQRIEPGSGVAGRRHGSCAGGCGGDGGGTIGRGLASGVMLSLGLTGRIWLCVTPVDGRKSFDGLSATVTTHLQRDPLSGDLFVFKNKRGDRLKILAWQGDGFVLYLRRLEKGTFAFPTSATNEASITATELAMILGGVEVATVRRRVRYQRPT
jgi:transposase